MIGYQPSNFSRSQCGGNVPGRQEPAARQIAASRAGTADGILGGLYPNRRSGTVNGFRCGRFNDAADSWWLCTTHLESMDAAINIDQGNYLLNYTRYWLGDRPVVVGGDFNRTPMQAPMVDWSTYYAEVDEAHNTNTWPTDGPYKKVDYTFTLRGRGDVGGAVGSVGCATDSDHCYLQGTVRFL